MRNKKLMLSVLLLIIGLTIIQAQEVIITSGGNASGSGSASYSIGQIFYTTNNGTNGSVVQGIQQPYEISIVSGIEETQNINLLISTYPNPTIDFLILKVDDSFIKQNMFYQLYNISGQLLESNKIESNETNINMIKFETSIYLLKIINNNQSVKTFKIIKN